ncbi:MAG: dihydrodipicolinate reductase [Desulfotomaculales bacterium]
MKAIQYGLGPVGCAVVRLGIERGLRYVGAVDQDPGKVGRDLGLAAGLEEPLGVAVASEAGKVLAQNGGLVVTHATGSSLKKVAGQLTELLAAGCTVVSTCEELSYPYLRYPEEAALLDETAKKYGGRLLGTGVNPGFIMDFLPLALTAAAQKVTALRVERTVDAARRREPLQRKVGVGLSKEEYLRGVEEGLIRHVGLPESAAMLAAGMGWKLERFEEEIEPVIADRPLQGANGTVAPGFVAGTRQVLRGFVSGPEPEITLDLKMALGEEEVDKIVIAGRPPLTFQVCGGIPGDLATAAVLLNSLAGLLELPPGLHTMLDLNRARFRLFSAGKR